MTRGRQAATYGKTPYGKLDADFCALVGEVWHMEGVRSDVRHAAEMVTLYALTRCWPASHYTKRDRDKWSTKATAAFRVSERELAELTGFSRPRVHRALVNLLDAGFVIELAPAKPRGEGRGTAPATYAFKCHLATQSMSYESVSSESPDPPQPVQAWDL